MYRIQYRIQYRTANGQPIQEYGVTADIAAAGSLFTDAQNELFQGGEAWLEYLPERDRTGWDPAEIEHDWQHLARYIDSVGLVDAIGVSIDRDLSADIEEIIRRLQRPA